VQVTPFGEGEIFKFLEGHWTVAVDGQRWEGKFVNVWDIAFAADNVHVAAEVRLSPTEYTIAVNGSTWSSTYECVWAPAFRPNTISVVAPVKKGKWFLAIDGEIAWDRPFVQLWHPFFSPDGKSIAAIVAPKFGQWTIAVDGNPWSVTFSAAVLDPTFSPNGKRIAAIYKEDEPVVELAPKKVWGIVVDGQPWPEKYDMVWPPVFSPDSQHVAAKAEKNGKYTIVIDGKAWYKEFEALWNPIFSPDGSKILVRAIEEGKYYRRIVPVNEILR
jgi:hypothetical protein